MSRAFFCAVVAMLGWWAGLVVLAIVALVLAGLFAAGSGLVPEEDTGSQQ